MKINLEKFKDNFGWHHHADEDELLLVRRGRLMMCGSAFRKESGNWM